VVAEEVRKLAEASNDAAKNIADLAQQIVSDLDSVTQGAAASAKSSDGARVQAEQTQQAIDRILEALGQITHASQDMAAVSEETGRLLRGDRRGGAEHSGRTQKAAQSVESIEQRMDEVARTSEQVARQSGDLSELASELRRQVGQFVLTASATPQLPSGDRPA
jgi:methyl-accepting chemotaxis protein